MFPQSVCSKKSFEIFNLIILNYQFDLQKKLHNLILLEITKAHYKFKSFHVYIQFNIVKFFIVYLKTIKPW